MKSFYLLSLLSILSSSSLATHLIGGEITCKNLGTTENNDIRYRISVTLLRDCDGVPLADNIEVGLYNNDSTNTLNQIISLSLPLKSFIDLSCGDSTSNLCVEWGLYQEIITVTPNTEGFILLFQTCCRNPSVNLIQGSSFPDQGFDLRCTIPPTAISNDNPPSEYIRLACVNKTTYWDPFSSRDYDGDSLVYRAIKPHNGGSTANPNPLPPQTLPELKTVIYNSGYSYLSPFGSGGTLKVRNNVIEIMPTSIGQYDFAFLVEEYRAGQLISTHNIELAILAVECNKVAMFNVPYKLQATRFSHCKTHLSWRNCNNQVDKYEVFRREEEDSSFSSLGYTDGPLRSFIDSSISQNGNYIYYVEGISDSFTSGSSNKDFIACLNLSTASQHIGDLNFFPNPVSSKLTLNSIHKIQTVIILDLFGKKIIKQNIPNLTQTELDLTQLSTGMYFVQVQTKNGFFTKRVLKE
jgi:hypothetical protein